MERASLGRRAAALLIDWLASTGTAVVFTGSLWDPRTNQLNYLIFVAEVLALTLLLGSSFGQLLLGMRIEHITGGRPSPLQVLIRTVLLALVIPAVVTGSDGRGLHDKAAGTHVTRFR